MTKKAGGAGEKLDKLGIEAVCERIEAGETQRELSKSIKVSIGALNAWLNRDAHAKRYQQAKEASAEAWLDRGLEAIEGALKIKGAKNDAQAARAYAQECARRAALRNPKYIEKTAHEHSGPGGGPIVTLTPKDATL